MAFQKMTAQSVKPDATKWFVFDTLVPVKGAKPIRLLAVHAGNANSEYRNDAVRQANEQLSRSSNKLTTAQLDALRIADADVFSRCVVKGWESVFEDDGTEAPLTVEKIAEFLKAIPPELFDRFRLWAKDPETFRDVAAAPLAADVAKG